jgi:hypothetical protein
VRSGNLQAGHARSKSKRAPFALGTTGPPAIALLWKNLISAGQVFSARLWIILAAAAVMVTTFLANRSDNSTLASAIGMAVGLLVVWSLFIGPQLLRQDLRQDLPLADVLKMYPMRGWEVALGELLAPAVILTGVQWILLLISAVLLWNAPGSYLNRSTVLAIGAGAALILPMLNLIILQIPNGAVLLFPAWLQAGKERAQGIEVTGQRIIAVFAQLLVFIVALIPATTVFAIAFFTLQMAIGRALALVPASLAATLVLAAEATLGLLLLGRIFDRFDISSELPPG